MARAGDVVSFLLVQLIGRALGLVYRGVRQSMGKVEGKELAGEAEGSGARAGGGGAGARGGRGSSRGEGADRGDEDISRGWVWA